MLKQRGMHFRGFWWCLAICWCTVRAETHPQGVTEERDAGKAINGSFCCSGPESIPVSSLCDGTKDCSSGIDELPEQCGCPTGEFNCGDRCIPQISRCDGTSDCSNGSDESNCEVYACLAGQFKCSNSICIASRLTCNRDDDCGDNSDEHNCHFRRCWFGEFHCRNGDCVRPLQVCDGVNDCKDGHDEEDCKQDDFAECGDGALVHRFEWCDGKTDCQMNHRDETLCGNCSKGAFRCTNGRCLSKSLVCDGQCDCAPDCMDEKAGCHSLYEVTDGLALPLVGKSIACPVPYRPVEHDLIISADSICDGIDDCYSIGFVSDEFNCPGRGLKSRVYGEFDSWHYNSSLYFHCRGDHDGRWLPITVTCNYKRDCLHGEDEANCSFPECNEGQFRCSNQQCIEGYKRCNAAIDCYDKSDELQCEPRQCGPHQKRCSSHQCIPAAFWCDHSKDCPDGSDEVNCDYRPLCSDDEFRCASGQCIQRENRCRVTNNIKDGCVDGSHLLGCEKFSCNPNWFKCIKGPCLDPSRVCDGQIDCPGSWNDEDDCPAPCSSKEPRCSCLDIQASCQCLNLTTIPSDVDPGVSYLNFSGNWLGRNINTRSLISLRRANSLDLSDNSITHLPVAMFQGMVNLKILLLSDNGITVLRSYAFKGLRNLRMLYLQGNGIRSIEPLAFQDLGSLLTLDLSRQEINFLHAESFVGLFRLRNLDLSHNKVKHIAAGSFEGLVSIRRLDLSLNNVSVLEPGAFEDLRPLGELVTDSFQLCCAAKKHGIINCLPSGDQLSSCEDLLSHTVLRYFLWILGILAVTGNLGVILWRFKMRRGNKTYTLLAVNLAIGDLCMGVYMLMISHTDLQYRGVYALYEQDWRSSPRCHLAGFMSTFSSEFTVLVLTLIAVERLFAIAFPLRNFRMNMKTLRLVLLACWLVALSLAGLPLVQINYFSNFYGRSSVCLALHLTPEEASGWQYSVFLFVVLNFISACIICTSYVWMYLATRASRRAVRRSDATQVDDRQMAHKMAAIVLTNVACWCPIIILGSLSIADLYVAKNVYAWVAVFILPLNAVLDPILYTFSEPLFRQILRDRFRRMSIRLGSMMSRTVRSEAVTNDGVDVSRFADMNQSVSAAPALQFTSPNAYDELQLQDCTLPKS